MRTACLMTVFEALQGKLDWIVFGQFPWSRSLQRNHCLVVHSLGRLSEKVTGYVTIKQERAFLEDWPGRNWLEHDYDADVRNNSMQYITLMYCKLC